MMVIASKPTSTETYLYVSAAESSSARQDETARSTECIPMQIAHHRDQASFPVSGNARMKSERLPSLNEIDGLPARNRAL